MKLPRSTLQNLRAEAKRRGLNVEDFAAEIIRAVAMHDLFAAVLDV